MPHPTPPLAATLTRLLGIPATGGPLAPEARGTVDLGPVVAEKWLIQAEPSSRIPLLLYRPREFSGRLPAVVITCGHGSSKSVPHLGYLGQVYARLGLACLVADPLGEEERHLRGGMGTRAHDAPEVAYQCELAGRPVMGKFVFDAMRAVDFLLTLPWIDPRRLAVAGNSLGGAVAGWLYALEPRFRAAIVSGWGFSDVLTRYGKHCTRVPNHKLRALGDWPAYLRLGLVHGKLLVINGDDDPVIDKGLTGEVWRDTVAALAVADPAGQRTAHWFCPQGGHRPYHGYPVALRFLARELGPLPLSEAAIAGLPLANFGTWCDRHGVALEKLYGTTQHYRGSELPDFGLDYLPPTRLAVLQPGELGQPEFTIEGWLAALQNR